MSIEVLNVTPASPPMAEVWIWIGHHADGSESMMATDLPYLGQVRHMPLMHSRRAIAEELQLFAERAQQLSRHTGCPIVRVELRCFRAVAS